MFLYVARTRKEEQTWKGPCFPKHEVQALLLEVLVVAH